MKTLRNIPVVYSIILIVFASTSCTSKPEKIVDFSEISPQAKNRHVETSDSIPDNLGGNQRPEKSVFLSIIDTLYSTSNWKKWDTLLYPDRFGTKTTEKWIIITPSDSVIALSFSYSDSIKTKNAFFNWLDCFGSSCRSYTVGDNLRIPKRNAQLFVGSTGIFVLESNSPIDESMVRSIFYKKPKQENWLYVISIPKKGKSTWKRVDLGIEKPISKLITP